MDIPNIFWKHYDLYRRKIISLAEFEKATDIDKGILLQYLNEIYKKQK